MAVNNYYDLSGNYGYNTFIVRDNKIIITLKDDETQLTFDVNLKEDNTAEIVTNHIPFEIVEVKKQGKKLGNSKYNLISLRASEDIGAVKKGTIYFGSLRYKENVIQKSG